MLLAAVVISIKIKYMGYPWYPRYPGYPYPRTSPGYQDSFKWGWSFNCVVEWYGSWDAMPLQTYLIDVVTCWHYTFSRLLPVSYVPNQVVGPYQNGTTHTFAHIKFILVQHKHFAFFAAFASWQCNPLSIGMLRCHDAIMQIFAYYVCKLCHHNRMEPLRLNLYHLLQTNVVCRYFSFYYNYHITTKVLSVARRLQITELLYKPIYYSFFYRTITVWRSQLPHARNHTHPRSGRLLISEHSPSPCLCFYHDISHSSRPLIWMSTHPTTILSSARCEICRWGSWRTRMAIQQFLLS